MKSGQALGANFLKLFHPRPTAGSSAGGHATVATDEAATPAILCDDRRSYGNFIADLLSFYGVFGEIFRLSNRQNSELSRAFKMRPR